MPKEPASIRYKNPGAMWGNNAIARKWGATDTVALKDGTGQGNNIAVFPTFVQGICAQLDLWRSSPRYKNKRFAEAIAVWSGGNSVENYISFVLARVPGMTRDTVMDDAFWRSSSGLAFLKAQAWHEAGKPYPAPEGDWFEAQRRVLGNVEPEETSPPVQPPPDVEPPEDEKPSPEQKDGFFKRFWRGITGGGIGAGIGFYDWRILAVLVGFALILFIGGLWLFGKDRLRNWISKQVS